MEFIKKVVRYIMDSDDQEMEAETGQQHVEEDSKKVEEPKSDELVLEDIDCSDMPNVSAASDKLKELKYHVVRCTSDNTLRFRQIDSNKKFEFTNQKAYDLLGDVLCDWVQAYMVDHYNMKKLKVPFKEETAKGKGRAPIFKSEDWETNSERALILIQGTGDVRAGYWARSVCMNDTLDLGSVIPDIEFAKSNGFSYIVLNPNYSKDEEGNPVDNKIRGMNHH